MDNYGISEDNPIKLKNSESAIIMLNHIVTDAGFHRLYHLKDYILKKNSIIEVYEIFSCIEEFYLLYIDVTHDINVWIAPSGFLFHFNWIENQKEKLFHGQDYYYKGDESCDRTFNFYHSSHWSIIKILLIHNFGVNYKVQNFPKSIFNAYYDYDYGLED